MKKFTLFLIILAAGFVSCSDDNTSYPSLISEMAMAYADGKGHLARIVTDSGRDCRVSNEMTGMDANESVRALISYVPEDNGMAKVYSAQAVPVLSNVTDEKTVAQDPTGIESAWMGGGFINFHLLPKTQGKKQRWAFQCDSTRINVLGGETHHLSLYHQQQDDPVSYSYHLYVCVALDSVGTTLTAADSITFVVHTFDGPKTWHFGSLVP